MADEPTEQTTESTSSGEGAAGESTLLNGGDPNTDPDKTPEGDSSTEGGDGEGEGGVPESYADFAMPEGVEVDEALLGEAAPVFKELGLNQEGAQKLIDLYAKQAQAQGEGQIRAFTEMKENWKNAALKDKEFGGEAFAENVGVASQAIEKFGTPELKELFEFTGVGNNPEVIRFMWRVGKHLVEDTPGGTGQASNPVLDRVAQLYPNTSS